MGTWASLLKAIFIGLHLVTLSVTTMAQNFPKSSDHQTSSPRAIPLSELDLNAYMGEWLEIASIPNRFQRFCVANTKAQYRLLAPELIAVTNSCTNSEGETQTAMGRAKLNSNTQAQLKVTFAHIFGRWIYTFGGDYWILALDPQYQWVFVGTPTRRYGWILARQPTLYPQDYQKITEAMRTQGYDPCAFRLTPQEVAPNSVNQERPRWCEVYR
ncbi:MAG: lipocalin family protein [Bdellovibrionaceae bacterium]|jgi:apolipoprotein D and lipocalin family protein|nr:lipocalin family protein [Pseudobdellovibrionaceae bacterium]